MVTHLIHMLKAYAPVAMARFDREEDGVTAIEYGLLAALIAVVIIAGASALGLSLNDVFNTIDGEVSGASTSG